MTYKKSNIPWNKGISFSKEIRMKMCIAQRKVTKLTHSGNFKKGQIAWNKGMTCKWVIKSKKDKPLSEETKEKISKSKKGVSLRHNGSFKKGIVPKSAFAKGNKPWNYIDGRSKILGPARYGDDWDNIRYLIYLRDRFTCQDCGIKGEKLHVHHIIPFVISNDNSLDNLISLCRSCHMTRERSLIKEQKIKLEV